MKVLSGPVEIAKLEGRKFLLQDIDHPGNPHSLAFSHRLKVEVGINIEVSHLDEVQARFLNQSYQPFHFFFPVCEPWKNEEIHRGVDPLFFRLNQGFHDILEEISLRPVIPLVKLLTGTVEADTNAVEPCLAKLCQPFRKTSISI